MNKQKLTAPTVAQKLKGLGLTVADVARLWGCSPRTVARKLEEQGTITVYELRSIADVYGFSVSECVGIVTGKPLTGEKLLKEAL